MAVDPYAPCTCGSGKKAKWCCGPIHEEMDRVFKLAEDGQHEAALRAVEEVVAAHADNPEVYGRKALLLYQLRRDEEAEAALEKAYQLNPTYPYGYYLRGRVRMEEGEIPGASLLYRKAVEYYDPGARSILASIYGDIAECEMRLNRPVAARAALEMGLALDKSLEPFRKSLNEAFGEASGLPLSARRSYSLKGTADSAPAEKKQAWQQALQKHTTGKLKDAQQAFEQILSHDPEDAAAWYNLALVKAWQGDNGGAIQALQEYVQREPDEKLAADAWALGEVLRCGTGVEQTEADYVEHAFTYQITNGPKVGKLIQDLEQEGRLLAGQMDQEKMIFTGILVEAPKLLAAGIAPSQAPRYAGQLLIMQNMVRVWGLDREKIRGIASDMEQRAEGGLKSVGEDQNPATFANIMAEAMVFPLNEKEEAAIVKQVNEGMAGFYEDTWIHRPLKSLSGVPPIDAAGHANLRKKLLGVVQFLEEASQARKHSYDFNRLRHKLNLQQGTPEPTGDQAGKPDISVMNAAELAGLTVDSLSAEQLEQAQQTAKRLDARELSAAFLKALVARPAQPEKPDCYPWYGQLIQYSVEEGQLDQAMEFVDAGEKTDCEANEGRRRNDYELWRGRLHARRKELDQAQDVFDRLIARVPGELKYRSTAAEAMLSAKNPARALRFAQEGADAARKQKDRDSEGHFLELAEAAERQVKKG